MSRITIDIPAAQDQRVADAFAARFGWNANSGLTKAQFVKAHFVTYIRSIVALYEADVAGDTARQAARTKATTEITPS